MPQFTFENVDSSVTTAPPVDLGFGGVAIAYSGKIYKFGGMATGGSPNLTSCVFDPATNTWSTLPSAQVGAYGCMVFEDGGYIYILGGRSSTGASAANDLTDMRRFDPAAGTITSMTSSPVTCYGRPHGKLVISGTTYLCFVDASNTVRTYNPSTNTWGTFALTRGYSYAYVNSQSLGGGAGACVINNRLITFCGLSAAGRPEIHLLNPDATRAESQLNAFIGSPPASNTSTFGAVAVSGSKMFSVASSTIYLTVGSLTRPIGKTLFLRGQGPSVVALGDYLYVIGGATATLRQNAVERHRISAFSGHLEVPTALTPVDSLSDWTRTGTQNVWTVGANGGLGTVGNSLYVTTSTASSSKGYTITAASTNHLYKNISVPSSINGQRILLRFLFNQQGETGFDYATIKLVDTSTTPVSGTQIATFLSGVSGNSAADVYGTMCLDLTAYAGQTIRLVFTWVNDGVGGQSSGGCSIDNINFVAVSLI